MRPVEVGDGVLVRPARLLAVPGVERHDVLVQAREQAREERSVRGVHVERQRWLGLDDGTHAGAVAEPLPRCEDDGLDALEGVEPLHGQGVGLVPEFIGGVRLVHEAARGGGLEGD